MRYLLIDGHPAQDRLSAQLLKVYAEALPADAEITRIAVRDLGFDPVLHAGYAQRQPWESDLERAAQAIDAADHVVFAFPMWWGGTPALLKGFIDRLFQPHFAFRYRDKGPWWDKLLAGRSADVLITLDTPPWYLRIGYGSAVVRQWKQQILEYSGFKPVRVHLFGPTREGNADRNLAKWQARVGAAAASSLRLKRAERVSTLAAYLEYQRG